MTLVPRKITYEVYFDQVDENGHTVDEPVVNGRPEIGQDGQPTGRMQMFVLYPHQFGELDERVSELGREIAIQLDQQQEMAASLEQHKSAENGNGNRAQRRAAARKKPTKATT